MTRRAVEQFTNPAPTIVTDPNDERHPFNRGVVIADIGNLTVYTFVDRPGEYWLDLYAKRPASDAQARAAFGTEAFNAYRQQALERIADAKIEEALAPEPEPAEDLRAKVKRLSDKVRAEALVEQQLAATDDAYVAKVRAAAQS